MTTQAPAQPTLDHTTATALADLLSRMAEAHQTLLDVSKEHRAALSAADNAALSAALEKQAQALHSLAALDSERRELIRRAIAQDPALRAADRAGKPEPRLRDLIPRLPEPVRDHLRTAAEQVLALGEHARREQLAVGQASARLSEHMDGLVRMICRKLGAAGVYGRDGRISLGPTPASGLDTTR